MRAQPAQETHEAESSYWGGVGDDSVGDEGEASVVGRKKVRMDRRMGRRGRNVTRVVGILWVWVGSLV